MDYCKTLPILLLSGLLTIQAQMDISGTVKDSSGGAISGATVRFFTAGNTAVTDAAGGYVIKGSLVGIRYSAGASRVYVPTVKGTIFTFSTMVERTPVRIEEYGLNGKRIAIYMEQNLAMGRHRVDLYRASNASQVTFIRARIGADEMMLTRSSVGHLSMGSSVKEAKASAAILAKAAANDDTIMASASGYTLEKKAITSYTGTYNFVLKKSLRIEAEKYDTMSGVWVEPCSEGTMDIASLDFSDWADYTVSVPASGAYVVLYQVASENVGKARILRSDATSLSFVTIPATGGSQIWTTVTSGSFALTAGVQKVRIMSSGGGWSLDWFELVPISAVRTGAIAQKPTGLTATAISAFRIDLKWTDNSNNEDGFKIERKTGVAGFTEIAQTGSDVTSYTDDAGLPPLTTYQYRIRAYNSTNNSTYSDTATAKTDSIKNGIRGRPAITATTIVSDQNTRLRGVSVWFNTDMKDLSVMWSLNRNTWVEFKKRGINYVRGGCMAPASQPTAKGDTVSDGMIACIDSLVANAEATGIYISLMGGTAQPGGFNYDDTYKFWQRVAPRYKDRTNVFYEVVNEPGPGFPQGGSYPMDQQNVMGVYNVMRAAAPQTVIIAGVGPGLTYTNDSHNIVVFHDYNDPFDPSTDAQYVGKYPLFMDETNQWQYNGGTDQTRETRRIKACEDRGISWAIQGTAGDAQYLVLGEFDGMNKLLAGMGITWTPDK